MDPYLTLDIITENDQRSNIRAKPIKQLEENIYIIFHDFITQQFLRYDIQSTNNNNKNKLEFIKVKTFMLHEASSRKGKDKHKKETVGNEEHNN